MDIGEIKARIRENRYVYSVHADYERKADNLTIAHVEQALLSGTLLEDYPDTGRGESCLVVGVYENVPVHVVCGWRGDKIVLITVYIPRPRMFSDPWTRGSATDE